MLESEGISICIYADCGEFGMPARDWRRILWLAEVYGWKPRGTTPPNKYAIEAGIWKGKPEDWDGSYFPAVGQEIVEGDAEELAWALERALPDIPETPRSEQKELKQPDTSEWFADVPVAGSTVSKRSQVRARRC